MLTQAQKPFAPEPRQHITAVILAVISAEAWRATEIRAQFASLLLWFLVKLALEIGPARSRSKLCFWIAL